jgi:hypothetical protein
VCAMPPSMLAPAPHAQPAVSPRPRDDVEEIKTRPARARETGHENAMGIEVEQSPRLGLWRFQPPRRPGATGDIRVRGIGVPLLCDCGYRDPSNRRQPWLSA